MGCFPDRRAGDTGTPDSTNLGATKQAETEVGHNWGKDMRKMSQQGLSRGRENRLADRPVALLLRRPRLSEAGVLSTVEWTPSRGPEQSQGRSILVTARLCTTPLQLLVTIYLR